MLRIFRYWTTVTVFTILAGASAAQVDWPGAEEANDGETIVRPSDVFHYPKGGLSPTVGEKDLTEEEKKDRWEAKKARSKGPQEDEAPITDPLVKTDYGTWDSSIGKCDFSLSGGKASRIGDRLIPEGPKDDSGKVQEWTIKRIVQSSTISNRRRLDSEKLCQEDYSPTQRSQSLCKQKTSEPGSLYLPPAFIELVSGDPENGTLRVYGHTSVSALACLKQIGFRRQQDSDRREIARVKPPTAPGATPRGPSDAAR